MASRQNMVTCKSKSLRCILRIGDINIKYVQKLKYVVSILTVYEKIQHRDSKTHSTNGRSTPKKKQETEQYEFCYKQRKGYKYETGVED